MDESADPYAQKDVEKHLLERAPRLPACIRQTFGYRHGKQDIISWRVSAHEVGKVLFHAQPLDDGSAGDGDEEADDRVCHATPGPKMLIIRTRLPRSTMGELMRKLKVTPSGRPARVNPMNRGMELQLQNGVTVPSSAPTTLPHIPLKRPMIFRLRSGGKKLCT